MITEFAYEGTKDGRAVTRYIWDSPPSVAEEPLAPKLTETLPVVVGPTFARKIFCSYV